MFLRILDIFFVDSFFVVVALRYSLSVIFVSRVYGSFFIIVLFIFVTMANYEIMLTFVFPVVSFGCNPSKWLRTGCEEKIFLVAEFSVLFWRWWRTIKIRNHVCMNEICAGWRAKKGSPRLSVLTFCSSFESIEWRNTLCFTSTWKLWQYSVWRS